jgi:hypothetical protein
MRLRTSNGAACGVDDAKRRRCEPSAFADRPFSIF